MRDRGGEYPIFWASSASTLLTSPRCVNACGKFPTSRRARGSYSSDSNPTSLARSPSRHPNVVGGAADPREQLRGLVATADQRQRVDHPERARQERSLARRQPVV